MPERRRWSDSWLRAQRPSAVWRPMLRPFPRCVASPPCWTHLGLSGPMSRGQLTLCFCVAPRRPRAPWTRPLPPLARPELARRPPPRRSWRQRLWMGRGGSSAGWMTARLRRRILWPKSRPSSAVVRTLSTHRTRCCLRSHGPPRWPPTGAPRRSSACGWQGRSSSRAAWTVRWLRSTRRCGAGPGPTSLRWQRLRGAAGALRTRAPLTGEAAKARLAVAPQRAARQARSCLWRPRN
mmetsp:Transcript_13176/g.50448  ORF Transcript_13176/g.50448 Transcript_13176/m.50448 type:complete len:237 (+) Transcript_13176:919-1629(+)